MRCQSARSSYTRTLLYTPPPEGLPVPSPPSPLPNSHPNASHAGTLSSSLLMSKRPRSLFLYPIKCQLIGAAAHCWQRRRWLQRTHGPQLKQRSGPPNWVCLEPSQPNKNQTKKVRVSMRMIRSAQLRDPASRTLKIAISAPIVQVSPLRPSTLLLKLTLVACHTSHFTRHHTSQVT
jgi:hypothetical protein